jgi:histidine triad (HIT) family protein
MSDEPTIFSRIIAREVPATIVHEDDQSLAFEDIHPAAPFHVLVIPKRPVVSIEAMSADDSALFGHLMWVCKKVANDAGHSAYRVVSNAGAGVGQSVFHLHFHVLAGRRFKWPPG